MIFKRRKSLASSQHTPKRYIVAFEMEDLCSLSGQTWEISKSDLEAPRCLVLELSDLESISVPSVSYEMEDLKFPIASFNLKELIAIEEEWKAGRKTFVLDAEHRYPFSFHGTRNRQNAKSICKYGWKVGNGNGIGSGIYFGFVPVTRKENKAKSKIPVPGFQDYKSNTMADHYTGFSGALLIAEVDWGNYANWEDGKVQQRYSNWCAKKRMKYYSGDAITEWGISNGYDSVKCPNQGYGVMLQHRYALTKKFWKTDKIRICYVYSLKDKKVEKIN